MQLSMKDIKLLVASRNWPGIEEGLSGSTSAMEVRLELNAESISAAVQTYIDFRVCALSAAKRLDQHTKDFVLQHLTENAKDTFLWVSLVCRELSSNKVRKWNIKPTLRSFPPD